MSANRLANSIALWFGWSQTSHQCRPVIGGSSADCHKSSKTVARIRSMFATNARCFGFPRGVSSAMNCSNRSKNFGR